MRLQANLSIFFLIPIEIRTQSFMSSCCYFSPTGCQGLLSAQAPSDSLSVITLHTFTGENRSP